MKLNFVEKNIHFIGIGGISMSGIAEILVKEGLTVTGSDEKESVLTNNLKKLGVKIFVGHSQHNIENKVDLVIYTAAVSQDNVELQEAKSRRIKVMERSVFLGMLTKSYAHSISITGTHGKTTTTGMISQIFLAARLDPTISIGGVLPSINSNNHTGTSEYFIVETCEYKNSFLEFFPQSAVVLNIDFDHPDFFRDIEHVRSSFTEFINKLPKDGLLVINTETENLNDVIRNAKCRIETFGESFADWTARNIEFAQNGNGICDVYYKDFFFLRLQMKVVGLHNIFNAVSACAIANFYNVPKLSIKKGLEEFTGIKRRFERKGLANGITIIDDYSHHPEEIEAVLTSAKRCGFKKLWCVFQPHTYTRTRDFLDDFAKVLAGFDNVILADIYAARETNKLGVSSQQLAEKINEFGGNAHYFESFDEIISFAQANCQEGDALITVGAGDVYLIADKMVN